MNELALFAGAGGGILGGHLLGWRTVCAVEWEPYPASVLIARQNDGFLPPFPIWDDVRTFDGKPWRGRVDVVSGGFPCQDISAAGRGAGIDGERSGMWHHMARIIGEVRPRYVFVENSPMLTSRGLGRVLGDLAALGYDAEWGVLGAVDVGAPHKRDRIWIVGTLANAMPAGEWREQRKGQNEGNALANADRVRKLQPEGHESDEWGRTSDGGEAVSDALRERQSGQGKPWYASDPAEAREGETDRAWAERVGHVWGVKSPVGRVVNGLAARMERLKAIGNGQVPAVAALAFKTLNERLK